MYGISCEANIMLRSGEVEEAGAIASVGCEYLRG